MVLANRLRCHIVGVCLALAVLSGELAGCAPGYQPPDLPISQTAMIVADNHSLAIVSVDKLRTSLLPGSGCEQVTVLPGQHVIAVLHRKNGNYAEASLPITLEAGRRYVLKSAFKGYGVTF